VTSVVPLLLGGLLKALDGSGERAMGLEPLLLDTWVLGLVALVVLSIIFMVLAEVFS
jgi:hypothetical protein